MKEYRLLEVNSVYDLFLKHLYEEQDENKTYSELMNKFYNSSYCESNYIERYFQSELGIESKLITYNNEFAQIRYDKDKDKDLFHIFLRQVKDYNPDVLYVSDINMFDSTQLKIIRETCKNNAKFVCYHFSFIAKNVKKVLPFYDLCFTGSVYVQNQMLKYNKNVKVVRHSFESTLLDEISLCDFSNNKVGFVGSIFIGKSFHTNRLDMLGSLLRENIDFDFYGKVYSSLKSRKQLLSNIFLPSELKKLRNETVEYLNNNQYDSCFGIEYYKTIAKYPLNLNIHAPIAGTGCGNQRMFEVTGIGSCLITDYREENSLCFDVDNEIVVYHNNEELTEKLKYLLMNPDEVKRIAMNGQKRTLKDYTYKQKALHINEYIQEIIN